MAALALGVALFIRFQVRTASNSPNLAPSAAAPLAGTTEPQHRAQIQGYVLEQEHPVDVQLPEPDKLPLDAQDESESLRPREPVVQNQPTVEKVGSLPSSNGSVLPQRTP